MYARPSKIQATNTTAKIQIEYNLCFWNLLKEIDENATETISKGNFKNKSLFASEKFVLYTALIRCNT